MNNFKDYNLLNNKTTSSSLNYNYSDYNNYKSWSNSGGSNIKVSSIDEFSNIVTSNFKTNRLQKLDEPYSTPTNTDLSWSNKNTACMNINKNDAGQNNKIIKK
jgi:hypothetical protein